MSIFSHFNKDKENINDIILKETAKEVLGINLEPVKKKDSSSIAFSKGLTALEIELLLKKNPALKKTFEIVYQRKLLEKTKNDNLQEYINQLLQNAFSTGNLIENGVFEITPLIGSTIDKVVEVAKEIATIKNDISVVKINFNGVNVFVDSSSDINEIINTYKLQIHQQFDQNLNNNGRHL